MCWYMPPPVLPQFEIERGRAVRGDGHVLGDRARLVVGGPAVLVDTLGPESLVPHGDLVGAGRDGVDLEDALQEDHRASTSAVGADHQRLRRLAIAADIAILVDGQRLQRRRRPRELHVAAKRPAVFHHDFFIGDGRRHSREHQGCDQQRDVRATRFGYEDWEGRDCEHWGGCRIPPHSPPVRVARECEHWRGRDDPPNSPPNTRGVRHASTAAVLYGAREITVHGSGFTKYSIASQKLRL